MVFLAMNLMGFAQKLGIGSGLMATVVTTMPMWLALWSRWGGERVPFTSWIGLALGVVGALLLALEGDFSATWLGATLAFGAPLAWSVGSYASRKLSLPAPAMASAAQWFAGGAMGLVVALWFEPLSALGQVTAKSWAAWVYLLVFGTLVALNAYLWLLQNTSAALAGSYSFVNPAVALLVGVALGGRAAHGLGVCRAAVDWSSAGVHSVRASAAAVAGKAQSGITAVASISIFARSSMSPATCTQAMAGKFLPSTSR